MPERPDLRQIAASLRESLDGLEREALVDILTYVLNEYVVEGPAPLGAAQVEKLEDLAGLSLAGLISALQTRLDVPGLEMFRVEGEEVRVQTASGLVSIQPGRPASATMPMPMAPTPAVATPPQQQPRIDGRPGAQFDERPMQRPQSTGRATADEAVSRGRGDLAGGERGVVQAPPPRPRGLSVTGRATSGANPSQRPADAAPPTPPPAGNQQPPASQPPQQGPSSSDRKEDDASIRFSLLELD
jgi:hypothetical protein